MHREERSATGRLTVVGSIRGAGVVLRRWAQDDGPALVSLYDTDEMNRWTPVPHPFDMRVAKAYLHRILSDPSAERAHLAITEDGRTPVGEILIFPTSDPVTCEIGYAVDAAHRGRSLAARSVRAVMPLATHSGYRRVQLRIAVGNVASEKVATRLGFHRDETKPAIETRKGFTLAIATWVKELQAESSA